MEDCGRGSNAEQFTQLSYIPFHAMYIAIKKVRLVTSTLHTYEANDQLETRTWRTLVRWGWGLVRLSWVGYWHGRLDWARSGGVNLGSCG